MSLYNMLHGVNPLTRVLLSIIGLPIESIPRFRDVYVDHPAKRIVVHTRTGGGNRPYYESEERCRSEDPEYFEGEDPPDGPWNQDMRENEHYDYDADDSFDSTYANFYFRIPEDYREQVIALGRENVPPEQKWRDLLRAMQSDPDSPMVKEAVEKVRPVIEKALAPTTPEGDPDV